MKTLNVHDQESIIYKLMLERRGSRDTWRQVKKKIVSLKYRDVREPRREAHRRNIIQSKNTETADFCWRGLKSKKIANACWFMLRFWCNGVG